MTLSYRRRPGVQTDGSGLRTPEGGRIVLDQALLDLLEAADRSTLDQILAQARPGLPTPLAARAALACLVEARLLERHPDHRDEADRPRMRSSALVSAIVVAWNGARWLADLIPTIRAQTHRRIETVIVDNGSSDDTARWVRREHPEVRLVALNPGRSLAGAINAGARESRGDHLLILNQDIRLHARAVEELLTVAEGDEGCAAVAANLHLMRAPGFLNGLGNRVESSSWGTDNAMGHLDLGQFDGWREVPSACFAAMLVPRRAWAQVGPADEGLPLYYEDVEWSYRARAFGLRIRVAPRAYVFHAFGASGTGDDSSELQPAKLRRVVHGRLRFALKLLPAPEAFAFVRSYLGEDLRGLRHALRGRGAAGLAYLAGWGRVIADLPGLLAARRRLEGCRASPTSILAGLPQDLPATRLAGLDPLLTSVDVVRDYGPLMLQGRTRPMPELAGPRRPVLVIVSPDIVDHRMAGPGLRYLEMGRALASDVDPVLAIPNETSLEVPGVQLVRYDEHDPNSLRVLVENADAAVVSGYMLTKFPFLVHTPTRLVVDLYDPIVLENQHYYLHETEQTQERLNQEAVGATNLGVQVGDFFICGSERQRDFWLGVLTANGRVNPRTCADDGGLHKLVDVVGIGLPTRSPAPGRGLKGRHPAIPEDARMVLWGGGIWNWLDPLTLIRAWPGVTDRLSRGATGLPRDPTPEPEGASTQDGGEGGGTRPRPRREGARHCLHRVGRPDRARSAAGRGRRRGLSPPAARGDAVLRSRACHGLLLGPAPGRAHWGRRRFGVG